MKLFDLHCDTLYKAYTEHSTLFDDRFHISFNKTKNFAPYVQCLAVWIPDEYRGENAMRLFDGCVSLLTEQLSGTDIQWCKTRSDLQSVQENNQQGVILTVESGAVLGGEIEHLPKLSSLGVKMMTLTWNGTNELGDGVGIEENNRGLSEFGRECVREMEKQNIIVDISHASERLFYDVAKIATRPIAASHSNAKAICPHRRNLTDEQFQIVKDSGGVVGLNFCAEFLNEIATNAKMYDIIKTTEHFLSLGGEQTIVMGSDFDGADIPSDINGVETMPKLYEMFVQAFGTKITEDIFFNNACRFFLSVL